jgi:hypothetical protein
MSEMNLYDSKVVMGHLIVSLTEHKEREIERCDFDKASVLRDVVDRVKELVRHLDRVEGEGKWSPFVPHCVACRDRKEAGES